MRPLVSSASISAVVVLLGSALAASSFHPSGRTDTPASIAPPLEPPADAPADTHPIARPEPREFFFTRAIYEGRRSRFGFGRRGRSWATDYPKADRQFLVVLKRLTNLDAYGADHAVDLANPDVRQFPFLYMLEVGNMNLTEAQVRGLRGYLEAGGFLMVDDFWGSYEWANFEREMARVLPGRPIEEVPPDHPIFNVFYDLDEIVQVPEVRRGIRGGPTWERDGVEPRVRGIFDDDGRLMVVINWNTDLGDAWEWAENPLYPLEYSTYAYQMGVNTIIYAMSH